MTPAQFLLNLLPYSGSLLLIYALIMERDTFGFLLPLVVAPYTYLSLACHPDCARVVWCGTLAKLYPGCKHERTLFRCGHA